MRPLYVVEDLDVNGLFQLNNSLSDISVLKMDMPILRCIFFTFN